MSEPAASPTESLSKDEMMTYLFAQMVMQQSNLAMMMLGQTAHPETGKPIRDLEAARLFIDQLEMLEAKTKGNLTKEEAALLKQNLMSLRLAFVEAADNKIGTLTDQLMLYCYRYDPSTGKYSAQIIAMVRLGGIATVLFLAGYIGINRWRETHLPTSRS